MHQATDLILAIMTSMEDIKRIIHGLTLEYFGADFTCVCKICSRDRCQGGMLDDASTRTVDPNRISVAKNREVDARHLQPLRRTGDPAASDVEQMCALCTHFVACMKVETPEYLSSLVEQISIHTLNLILWALKNEDQSTKREDIKEPPDTTDQHTTRRIAPKSSDLLLDLNTACNFLHLSEDGKAASYSFISRNHPETPESFTYPPQVLSGQSFSEGCHYWDVEVSRSDCWRVGVCYPSIDRKAGNPSMMGNNEKSWCLSRSHNHYSVIHDRKKTSVFGCGDHVRVSLDYESGLISFYGLGFPDHPLYTFTTTFTEPLHAAFGVWRGCIKISGGTSGGVRNFNEMSGIR